MLRETQREVNMDRPFESRLHIDYSTNNHHSQLRSKNCPDCCFIAILSRRKPTGPRLMRRLWSNTRERTQSNEREQAEGSSYPKAIEGLLTETARKGYPDPEEVDNPMIAPQDHEIHQSRGVLELQNRDLLATTHRSILVPSYSCDYPWVALQKLPWKVTCEAGSQGRSQEAEDSEKQKVRSNAHGYFLAVTLLLAMRLST